MVHAIGRDGDITQRLAGCPFAQILDGSGLQKGSKPNGEERVKVWLGQKAFAV